MQSRLQKVLRCNIGFLDGSTNNIILDAVLTDIGRTFLARNDGSFSIHKFALGDDEVNYGLVQKYGRTLGREKIEKNTPIFEALTNQAHAQKHRLISVSNQNLVRLPALQLDGSTDDTITLGTTVQKQATVTLSQTINDETTIDVELRDQTFLVEVPNLFCQISRVTPENIDGQQRALYILTRSPSETANQGSKVEFTLSTKSLTDAMFDVYGSGTTREQIRSYIRVTGVQSGSVKEITLVIDKRVRSQ